MRTTFLRDLGAFMWLLHDDAAQSKYPLRVLYWRLWPAMQQQQYAVLWQQQLPVGYVNWAWLTSELSATYRESPCVIREADWVGGDQLWFMELLAQPHALQTLMQFVSLQFDAGTLAQWHDVRAGQPLRVRSLRFPRREKVDG